MFIRGRPPGAGADYFKAHGLGNDYLVFEEGADNVLAKQGCFFESSRNKLRLCDSSKS